MSVVVCAILRVQHAKKAQRCERDGHDECGESGAVEQCRPGGLVGCHDQVGAQCDGNG